MYNNDHLKHINRPLVISILRCQEYELMERITYHRGLSKEQIQVYIKCWMGYAQLFGVLRFLCYPY